MGSGAAAEREPVVAFIVHGGAARDRLRLIESLASGMPPEQPLAVLLCSPGVGAFVFPPPHLPPGSVLQGVSAGCPCCTGRVAVRVALVRLLRESQPRRLFIELPQSDHLRAVLSALGEEGLGDLRLAGVLQAHSSGAPLDARVQPLQSPAMRA